MPRRNFLLPLVALAGAVLFLVILTQLLLLRYERGDVYPAYSTLRADPLGARAIYEALGSIPGYKTTRGITFLHRELDQKPATLLYLGLNASDLAEFPKEEVTELDDYVNHGGRVIITFSPEKSSSTFTTEESDDGTKHEPKPVAKDKKTTPTEKKATTAPADPSHAPTEEEKYEREELRKEEELAGRRGGYDERAYRFRPTLTSLWGFGEEENVEDEKEKTKAGKDKAKSQSEDLSPDEPKKKPEVLARRATESGLEENVPWKSAIYFLRLGPDWTPLYTAKEKPVVIWRKRGKGEIIVATDSYFVSNQGLREDRRPILLNLLAGPPGLALFDETHLGTEQQEGVVFLLEKYRLEGYLFGLFGVLGLFLWRNSVPLVPPPSGRSAMLGGAVSGKDSRGGLVNLLRRNIAFADILKISVAEWKRTVSPTQNQIQVKVAAMDARLAAGEAKRPDQIVSLYHELREINNPSRTPQSYATKS